MNLSENQAILTNNMKGLMKNQNFNVLTGFIRSKDLFRRAFF